MFSKIDRNKQNINNKNKLVLMCLKPKKKKIKSRSKRRSLYKLKRRMDRIKIMSLGWRRRRRRRRRRRGERGSRGERGRRGVLDPVCVGTIVDD